MLAAQICVANNFTFFIRVDNFNIDTAIISQKCKRQTVDISKDSISIFTKKSIEIISINVANHYPYFLELNRSIPKKVYHISLIQINSVNSVYNTFNRHSNKTLDIIPLGSVKKNSEGRSAAYTPIFNGQSFLLPVFIPESNSLVLENLSMYINKFTTPFQSIAVEITIIKTDAHNRVKDLCRISQDTALILRRDTFQITNKGLYGISLQTKVSGSFLIVLNHIYKKQTATEYINPIFFGIGKRKLFNNNNLTHINLGYVKHHKKAITTDLQYPFNITKNEQISFQLNFK